MSSTSEQKVYDQVSGYVEYNSDFPEDAVCETCGAKAIRNIALKQGVRPSVNDRSKECTGCCVYYSYGRMVKLCDSPDCYEQQKAKLISERE